MKADRREGRTVRNMGRIKGTLDCTGQVVVVTGATSGIGRALARAFVACGARVVGTGRDQDRLAALSSEVALALTCDVTRDADVDLLAAVVEDRFGRLDVLVDNAGIGLFRTWDETGPEEVDLLLQVNLLGVLRVDRALVPLLRRTRRSQPASLASVVHVASVAGRRPFPLHAGYCVSKHALLGWSGVLGMELAAEGIHVCAVCPPAIDTPFFARAGWPDFARDHAGLRLMAPERVAEETLEALQGREPVRVVGRRARALDFLAHTFPARLPHRPVRPPR